MTAFIRLTEQSIDYQLLIKLKTSMNIHIKKNLNSLIN